MPQSKIHRYEGANVVVTWDAARCIHAAECVRGLPAVFDPKAKPWIAPDAAASAQALAATIAHCPTGALKLADRDGTAREAVPAHNSARVNANGPNYLVGDLALVGPDGMVELADTRMALCRCGDSANKPLCDNSHRKSGFAHAGALPANVAAPDGAALGGPLRITAIVNGPIKCLGALTTHGADGASAYAEATFFCRCGHSGNKPYCDGTHKHIGFKS
jgi:CDGSH-type Zn-finger protein/uncharacterized Fe-S cluster protein YjdI